MWTEKEVETFVNAYVECAIWSSTNEDGEPLDNDFDESDLSDEALKSMREDCVDFLNAQEASIQDEHCNTPDYLSRAGHDFWLTRNRHGAGFWDGDWKEPFGRMLTDAAHVYGSSDLYVGDDGKLYVS